MPLDTVGDTLTNYYMIPVDDLPLLDPLRLIPVVGNPLADLLQPDMKVLVDLGYGSITDGWSQGPANVPTPFELFPTDINWPRRCHRAGQGRTGKASRLPIADLENPDNYQIPSLLDNPTLAATGGCRIHLRPDRHPATDVAGAHPGAAWAARFPLSDATLLVAAGRHHQ